MYDNLGWIHGQHLKQGNKFLTVQRLQKKNHVVIWDKIITSKEDANIHLVKESPEYAITDNAADLRYVIVF